MTAIEAIGYVRVSTERQAGEVFTSLADQQAAIEALAATHEVSVGAWYRDQGKSGATVEGRPAFRDLLAWCDANPRTAESGLVLVLNDSRFGRFPDPEEAAYWRHHLRRLGWVVRFAEGDHSPDGTARVVMRAIGAAQATEYRENLQRNVRRGMKGSAAQGYWTREAPYGYRRRVVWGGPDRILEIGQLKAPNEKVRLAVREEEAKIVRWVFESYCSREHSASSLVRELKTMVPGRRWSPTVVHAMLRNPAYQGDVVGGRRPAQKDERKVTPIRERAEWYGMRDAHPPIVSRELWQSAQSRMAGNRKLGRAVRTTYLLSGIMRCTHCGKTYAGGGGGKSRDAVKVREFRRFYRDSGGIDACCPGRIGTVMRHIVDDAVVEELSVVIGSPEVRHVIEEEFQRLLTANEPDRTSALRIAKSRLEKKRENLVASIADGVLESSEAAAQLGQVREGIAEVERQLEAERFRGSERRSVEVERARLVELASNFCSIAEELTGRGRAPELRSLIEPWLHEVTFDKATRELTLAINPLPVTPSLRLNISPGRG